MNSGSPENLPAHAGPQGRIQRVLFQSLAEAKLKNPAYSLRAFAKKLKLSPAALSEILNGKRAVSVKLADRILTGLDADPAVKGEILGSFRKGASVATDEQKRVIDAFTQLSVEQFKTIADWYHFAILCLFETSQFTADPDDISRRLGVRKADVIQALQRLERLGMLERSPKGKLRLTGKQFHTADGPASSAVRLSHGQSLELAKKSLEVDAVDIRDFTSLTMAIDPEKMDRARKLIRQFRTKLARELEVDPKGEVYMLSVGLFPLSRS